MSERCKSEMWMDGMDGWHSSKCSRKAVRDGYCKQHHPDAMRKRREEAMTEPSWREVADHRAQLNHEFMQDIKRLEQRNAELKELACWLRDNVHPNLLEHPYYQESKRLLQEAGE